MSDSRYKIPVRLDAPIPIFAWELVDLIVVMMLMGVTMLMGQSLIGIAGSVLVLMLAKKLRQGQKQGQVQHLLWRIGVDMDKPLRKLAANPLLLEYFE